MLSKAEDEEREKNAEPYKMNISVDNWTKLFSYTCNALVIHDEWVGRNILSLPPNLEQLPQTALFLPHHPTRSYQHYLIGQRLC